MDSAISYLQMAATLTGQPSKAFGDLSATYIAIGESADNVYDLVTAVEYASLAVQLDPSNAAARFNDAVALDQLGLADAAYAAWSRYEQRDSTSSWAGEAMRRMRADSATMRLQDSDTLVTSVAEARALAAADPLSARQSGWDRVLPDWGLATIAHCPREADSLLSTAAALGDALLRAGGDGTLSAAVQAIRLHAADRTVVRRLALAHVAYGRAMLAYRAGQYTHAATFFARSLRYSRESPQLNAWATLFHAATLVYTGRVSDGERIFRHLIATVDEVRYPALAGRAWWDIGTTLARRGASDQVIGAYKHAAPLFVRAGERESIGAMQCLAMEAEFSLGRTAEGFETFRAALASLSRSRSSVWLHNLLYIASLEISREGLSRAALAIEDEDVAVASRTGRAADAVEARLLRAQLLEGGGQDSIASEDLNVARAMLSTLGGSDQRGWLTADLQLAQATAWARTAPLRSVGALDSVVSFFSAPPNPTRLLSALLSLATARLTLGDVDGGTMALDRATALINAERKAIVAAPLRESLVANARRVFDQAVMVHLDRGDTLEALLELDLARSSLLMNGSSRSAPARRRGALRTKEYVLDYALIGDTLLVWAIHGAHIHLVRHLLKSSVVASTIAAVRVDAESRSSDTALRGALAQLFDVLVAPVSSDLGPQGSSIVVVVGGALTDVPFAGLFDAHNRQYLIQEHAVRVELSLAQATFPKTRTSADSLASVLVVADPAVDERSYPGLRPLRSAELEARDVAALYPDAKILLGDRAARSAVVSSLTKVDVVHIAAHAMFDPLRPEASHIVLAPSPDGTPGTLSARAIGELHLRKLRLAVLSACETIRTPGASYSGMSGFATAFLSAGASGVVGSLWRVDDAPTAALMRAFHRAYRESGDAGLSLRMAQLDLMRSSDPMLSSPASWAAFLYVGR